MILHWGGETSQRQPRTAYGVWIQGPMVGYKDRLGREGKKTEWRLEQAHGLGFSCLPKQCQLPKAGCGFSFNSTLNILAKGQFFIQATVISRNL